jgi:hypothetical protein
MSEDKKLDEIINELKNQTDSQSAEKLLFSKLNESQREKLKRIISDDEAVKRFLSSEQAQKIIKKMTEKGD